MPITINVGLSEKRGTANYGSVGASCNVSFEAGHDLLDTDLAGFHQKVKNAYVACRQAVKDELSREQAAETAASGNGHANGNAASNGHSNGNSQANGNGHASNCQSNGNGQHSNGYAGNGNGQGSNGGARTVSEKQLNFAKQLSKSIRGLGVRNLENLVQKMYGKPLVGITSMEASGLIDTLKGIKDGSIDLDSVLEGNAA
jgi:hypothetical protein